jgi:hypothetical protein
MMDVLELDSSAWRTPAIGTADIRRSRIVRLWLGNIAPDTSDDELKALLKKYAPDLECVAIKHEDGTGSRPGALLEFTGGGPTLLGNLALRLNGMYWKGRELTCSTMLAPP